MQPLHAISVYMLHMYSAFSKLILDGLKWGYVHKLHAVVVWWLYNVHAQLHILYELILRAFQCPVRVDIGSSRSEK